MNIIKRYISFRTVSTSSSGIQSIVAGSNITVDNTDPQNPIVSSTGGGQEYLIYDTVDMSAVSNYTAVQGDNNRGKLLGKSTAQTFTLPQLLVGTQFVVRRTGAGVITFVAGIGVTITNTKGDLTDPGQGLLSFISYKSQTEVFLDNGTASGGGSVTLASLGTTLQTAANDTPLDADTWNFYDAVDAILKKVSWANIKATLKTYFDTLYAPTVSQLMPTVLKNSAYSVQPGEYVPIDTTFGIVAITLPTAPANGTVITLKRILGSNNATYTCGGSDVLNQSGGSTSGTLSLTGHMVTLTYRATGAIWYVETSLSLSSLDARFAPISVTGPTRILISTSTANSDVTPNTLADLVDYVIPVVSGRYFVKVWAPYSAGAVSCGLRIVPTGATITSVRGTFSGQLTATTRSYQQITAVNTPTVCNASSLSSGNVALMEMDIVSSGSGNVQLRFASEEASTAITVISGGIIEYTKIA